MREQRKTWMLVLMLVIGMPLTMLAAGCSKTSEFVIETGIDREFVEKNQVFTVPENGVFLSDRAFKHYSKGCE